MSEFPASAEAAERRLAETALGYSICTMVTDAGEYSRLVASFRAGGFDGADCEYLYIDNSRGNRFDSFAGYNLFLSVARGEHIILCHQDIELLGDGRERLDRVLAELTARHPEWGLCGNAGGVRPGRLALRISDPHGDDLRVGGPFPVRVTSLDENFIVARRSANLALSRDLSGFHHYGADLCLIAGLLGHGAYVVDFHLRHRSPGKVDAGFHELQRRLIAKYQAALRPRWIATTCTSYFLSGSRRLNRLANSGIGRKLARVFGKTPNTKPR